MKFIVFKDVAGEWRWRLVATNGNIIATSGEGYKNRSHAVGMITRIIDIEQETVSIEFSTRQLSAPEVSHDQ